MDNHKENNQRQDSVEETELQTYSPIYFLDDGDDPFGIHAIGKIALEITDGIELPTVREEE